ncbi:flagellar protein FliT [Metabacillus litoralis]|uniref:Flagellar protein FliT n=1 Tax=Metabacillus litoralis TaxID=152268 RepID=A0A5C6W144_9BACI|nr:flagellar protein FliT [Metabacillus litoralis]TXC90985.1 flagellar protein FliT [Metabacillus litoralis]
MNAVQKLYDTSVDLLSLLEKDASSEGRDQFIQEIESYLQVREEMMKMINPPYTPEQKDIGSKLIELNKKINLHLAGLKKEIQVDLRKLNNNKISKKKYQDAYQPDTISGLFYDKRN